MGQLNTDDSWHWCQDRNMSCLVKEHEAKPWAFNSTSWWHMQGTEWDYDFIFDEKKEALTFILGYL
jgi:hypothetical protein